MKTDNRRRRRAAGPLVLLSGALALAGCGGTRRLAGGPPRPAPPPEPATATRIELGVDPLLDLYFWVRAQAADTETAAEPGFERALEAARGLQRQMGSFGGWGPLDSRVFGAEGPAELVAAFSELPEPYVRRGRSLSIRDDAVRLTAALVERWPGFLAGEWPARRAELGTRVRLLEGAFLPKHRQALLFMMESLGIPDPALAVPMFLVTRTNPPGAMTYGVRGGGSATVVEVTVGGTNGLLMEILLHEATHVLDDASVGESAFDRLRQLLEARGFTRRDRLYHDLPHMLMFVQAAETMRRIYDPDHVAYGAATDLYERSGEPATVVDDVWPRFLDGEVTREAALQRIVDTLDPRPEAAPAQP